MSSALFKAPAKTIEGENLNPTAKVELDTLNNWNTDAMDLAVCSKEYSQQYSQYIGRQVDVIDTGPANGWIIVHTRKLAQLGYKIRWNCEKGKFEATISEQQPENICMCQRTFITRTSP
jgi:hypothetical protein